jgi:peptidoglycan hydrolase-like protein with peptidoglycan-binding domain
VLQQLALLVIVFVPGGPFAEQAGAGQTKAKAPAAQTKSPTTSKSKAASAAKTPAKAKPKATARRVVRRPAVPVGQSRPTKDRYAEIQQALTKGGYYEGTPDGVWGDSSVKALQAFQTAQGLDPTGKIDSLTLIRLDLGPNYDQPPADAEGASQASAAD